MLQFRQRGVRVLNIWPKGKNNSNKETKREGEIYKGGTENESHLLLKVNQFHQKQEITITFKTEQFLKGSYQMKHPFQRKQKRRLEMCHLSNLVDYK